jgi:hypothetical protein
VLHLLAAMPVHAQAQREAAAISLPDLSVAPRAAGARDFDKYYYFHRADTDHETALADIRQCDALSRGLTPGTGDPKIVGGAALAGLSGAIASGNRRALRRVNMRRCMFFKGYGRYGLDKAVWQRFNFEEGASPLPEAKRTPYLEAQASAASGAKPATGDLGE